MPPVDELPVDDDTAADPGSQRRAEDDPGILSGAVEGLGDGEAVAVVGHADRQAENRFQIHVERLSLNPGGVAVLHQPGLRIEDSGHADTDGSNGFGRLFLQGRDQPGNRLQRPRIVAARRRHAQPHEFPIFPIEQGARALGAAEIQPDPDSGRAPALGRGRDGIAGCGAVADAHVFP